MHALKIYHRTSFWGSEIHGRFWDRGRFDHRVVHCQAVLENFAKFSGCCQSHGNRVAELTDYHFLSHHRGNWNLFLVDRKVNRNGAHFFQFAMVPNFVQAPYNWSWECTLSPQMLRMEFASHVAPILLANQGHKYPLNHVHLMVAIDKFVAPHHESWRRVRDLRRQCEMERTCLPNDLVEAIKSTGLTNKSKEALKSADEIHTSKLQNKETSGIEPRKIWAPPTNPPTTTNHSFFTASLSDIWCPGPIPMACGLTYEAMVINSGNLCDSFLPSPPKINRFEQSATAMTTGSSSVWSTPALFSPLSIWTPSPASASTKPSTAQQIPDLPVWNMNNLFDGGDFSPSLSSTLVNIHSSVIAEKDMAGKPAKLSYVDGVAASTKTKTVRFDPSSFRKESKCDEPDVLSYLTHPIAMTDSTMKEANMSKVIGERVSSTIIRNEVVSHQKASNETAKSRLDTPRPAVPKAKPRKERIVVKKGSNAQSRNNLATSQNFRKGGSKAPSKWNKPFPTAILRRQGDINEAPLAQSVRRKDKPPSVLSDYFEAALQKNEHSCVDSMTDVSSSDITVRAANGASIKSVGI